ncbi:MAG TPA: aminotransferase class IV [Solirubrobacterales bacterium]|nr:aminotransferase class IV [Solirubrobacterales bacterium]
MSQGVFETVLVLDGVPVELDAHLTRLRASLGTLFPDHPPPNVDVPPRGRPYGPPGDGTSVGALRIAVAPAAHGGLEARVEQREAPRGGTASLASVTAPGGLGGHKWVDRSLLDEAQAALPGDALPLIVDSDGAVLEASRANLFAVLEGVLHTPPLDGRILPGVTRARVIERADSAAIPVHERALSRDDLLAADEVFLTGSVRGIEPATSLDGTALGDERRVSDALR